MRYLSTGDNNGAIAAIGPGCLVLLLLGAILRYGIDWWGLVWHLRLVWARVWRQEWKWRKHKKDPVCDAPIVPVGMEAGRQGEEEVPGTKTWEGSMAWIFWTPNGRSESWIWSLARTML